MNIDYCWIFIKYLKYFSSLLYNVKISFRNKLLLFFFLLLFVLFFLSGASDQRDLLLSQPAPPSAVELQPVGAGPQVQGGRPQCAQVFVCTDDRISHFLLMARECGLFVAVDHYVLLITARLPQLKVTRLPRCVWYLQPSQRDVGGSAKPSRWPFTHHWPRGSKPGECDSCCWTQRVGNSSCWWNRLQLQQGDAAATEMWVFVGDNWWQRGWGSAEVLLCEDPSLPHQALWTSLLLLCTSTRPVRSRSTSSIHGCCTAPT